MLKTFSIGGVHPHENKLSAHQPIITAEVPAKAVILLGQHIGAPAKPVVAKGDVVKVGTKIAEPAGFVSAAIHSSVSGKVAKIDTIVDASGYAKPAIFIDVEGDEWEETIDRSTTLVKECELSAEEIVKKIADAGIVGLGGACFPTQVKLCPPPSFKAECVIINAVECEPYLTADHQLMLEHAEEIMVGVSILMKAVKVNKAFIGIENNKPDAIELMTKVASYEDMMDFVAELKDQADHIDWLVSNAGVSTYAKYEDYTFEEWTRIVNTNLSVPVFMVKELRPMMSEGGSILFTGSYAGQQAYSSSLVYGVTKAAIHFLAKSLVKEFEPKGITVNAIAPGFIETPWHSARTQESYDRINKKIALHRFGTVEEVADMAFAVLGNGYMNGSVVDIHGGYDFF